MKKIMFLMAATLITVGGINVANAQTQTKTAPKTEQKSDKKKEGKKAPAHHSGKHHEMKKKEAAPAAQK